MGFKDLFNKKNKNAPKSQKETISNVNEQTTLAEDIVKMSDWIVLAMNSSGYKLDYTVQSMKEIDRFFDEQKRSGGLLESGNRGPILFAIGSYIGETAKRLYGGEWITDDNDHEGEIKAVFKFKDGSEIYPMMKAIKRYKLGSEEGVYGYFYGVSQYIDHKS